MTNLYIGPGEVIDYANAGAAISAGDVVAAGDIVGIAMTDIAATTGVGAVGIEGIFTVPKTAGTAWNQGDAIDWDASAGEFHKGVTPAAGDVVSAGIATVAAASAATTAQLKLLGGALGAAVT